ncbi:MAG: TauD/TfdA family dioxygenase [Gammaproteobacteria bacterium]|nr:TauD/TfdA family dioxygenase [Gammaproteobacteria bacterium]
MNAPFERIRITPVSPALGAEISGVDISAPLDDETVAEIRAALLEYLVVFFRDQNLTPKTLIAFSERFGKLTRYPFVKGMDEYPDVVEVVKREDETHNFGGIWHSDTTYLDCPPMGSVLYAVEIPPVGGDTLFANMYLAYETLSEGMKEFLDGLNAVNSAQKPDAAVGRQKRVSERPGGEDQTVAEAVHPVVRTHPETGRKALYVNRGHTVKIDGFTEEESRPILEYLYNHQTRPEFTCRFRWTPGAVAFWDNRPAQHNAINDYQGYRRVMHRVTLAGETPA